MVLCESPSQTDGRGSSRVWMFALLVAALYACHPLLLRESFLFTVFTTSGAGNIFIPPTSTSTVTCPPSVGGARVRRGCRLPRRPGVPFVQPLFGRPSLYKGFVGVPVPADSWLERRGSYILLSSQGEGVPVNRLYNPWLTCGTHLFFDFRERARQSWGYRLAAGGLGILRHPCRLVKVLALETDPTPSNPNPGNGGSTNSGTNSGHGRPGNTYTVYVTAGGKRHHRQSCPSTSQRTRSMTLEAVRRNYTPARTASHLRCSKCRMTIAFVVLFVTSRGEAKTVSASHLVGHHRCGSFSPLNRQSARSTR